MRLLAGMLALLAACSFDTGASSGGGAASDGGNGDGPSADIDGGSVTDAFACEDLLEFAPSNFGECEVASIMPSLTLDQGIYRLDSDTGVLLQPDDSEVQLD